jgi:hypothetical protein
LIALDIVTHQVLFRFLHLHISDPLLEGHCLTLSSRLHLIPFNKVLHLAWTLTSHIEFGPDSSCQIGYYMFTQD